MKKLFKGFVVLILLVIIFVATLIIINSVDDKPHKLRSEYNSYLNNPKLDDNIFVYLVGLASADNQETNPENIYKIGKEKVLEHIELFKKSDYKNFKTLMESSVSIKLKGNKIENIACVFDYKNTDFETLSPCNVTLAQINKKNSDNKIFFENLSKANKYSNYSELFGSHGLQIIINANQTLAAKLILEAKAGNAELAYKTWLENYSLNKKIFQGEHSSLGLALAMVNYSSSIKSLNAMLYYQPEIIEKNYAEIKQVFEPIELKNMPIGKIGMVEYPMFYFTITNNQKFFHKPFYLENSSLNQFFDFYDDFAKLSESEMRQYPKNLREFSERYNKSGILPHLSFRNPIFKVINGLMLNGLSQGVEIFNQIKNIETRSRISLAIIEVIKQKIPKEKIQKFLDENKKTYYNAINGEGLKYNIENNSIYTKTEFGNIGGSNNDIITQEVFF